MYRIGIDIGGTTIKAGVVDEENRIIEQAFAPTRAGRPANEIVADVCTVAESAMNLCLVKKEDCLGVGIACAGTCDPAAGKVVRAYNLGFFDVPVCDLVSFRLGMPVRLANDADAAALGEAYCGSAQGAGSVLFIGFGTGVGAGIVLNGRIWSGCGRGGVEAGHMKLVHNGELCTCGEKGCFEAYASATGLIREAKKAAAADPSSVLNELSELTGKAVFDAADGGDPAAVRTTGQYMEYLSAGVTSLVNILDPEVVVLGGGIAKRGERFLEPVRNYVNQHCFGGPDRIPPQIVLSSLGDSAGILGAAALFGDPQNA